MAVAVILSHFNFFERGELNMGANHAGDRKRQKAKNTRKIAATIEKKAAEKAGAAKSASK